MYVRRNDIFFIRNGKNDGWIEMDFIYVSAHKSNYHSMRNEFLFLIQFY